jgi:hypothetical protein
MVFAVTELKSRYDKPRKGSNSKSTFVGLFSDKATVKKLLKTDPNPECSHYHVSWCWLDSHCPDPTDWIVTKDGEWI